MLKTKSYWDFSVDALCAMDTASTTEQETLSWCLYLISSEAVGAICLL